MQAKNGDKVKIHYQGTLTDGTVFDSSYQREPLEFTLGEGQVIPGFENGVMGMEVEETKSISIEPEDAYGERNDNMIISFPKANLPEDFTPQIGQQIQLQDQQGNPIPVVIQDIKEEELVLDANHPLAGKVLNFDIELVEIAS